jgi:hypothetical protein
LGRSLRLEHGPIHYVRRSRTYFIHDTTTADRVASATDDAERERLLQDAEARGAGTTGWGWHTNCLLGAVLAGVQMADAELQAAEVPA